jgi:hypothetical protein
MPDDIGIDTDKYGQIKLVRDYIDKTPIEKQLISEKDIVFSVFLEEEAEHYVSLVIKFNEYRWNLLMLTPEGTLRRSCFLPNDIGLQVDQWGRIIVEREM